jgi:hypothetical protein
MGCLWAFAAAAALAADMPFVEVDPQSSTAFRERGTDKPFVAIGVNYFDHQTGWAPKLWQRFDETRVREQLALLRDQGFNTIRVFITLQSFEREAGALTPEGRDRFRQLLDLCKQCSIYVIPTGPELWEGRPDWCSGDRFADEAMLAAEESWWRAFTAAFAGEPAILAWDLANEPAVGWTSPAMQSKWNEWLVARYHTREAIAAAWNTPLDKLEPAGQIEAPPAKPARGNRKLLDYQHFREHLGDAWARRMTAAIRAVDRNHMVTIGQIQWASPLLLPSIQHYAGFDLRSSAKYVDFTTIHFYALASPRPCDSPEGIGANRIYLQALLAECRDAGKPVMLGEFGWYGGGGLKQGNLPDKPVEHQAEWCNALLDVSRGQVCGWLNWAFADPPEATDLSRWSGLWTEDLKLKPWGKDFGEFARGNTRRPQPSRPLDAFLSRTRLDRAAALTDPAVGNEYRQGLMRASTSPGE